MGLDMVARCYVARDNRPISEFSNLHRLCVVINKQIIDSNLNARNDRVLTLACV